MAQMTKITMENLDWFRDWLQNDANNYKRIDEIPHNFRFELPLSVILQDNPELSPRAQQIIAQTIAKKFGHQDIAKDLETMVNSAEAYPVLLAATNTMAQYGNVLGQLLAILKNRTFEQNIPALYAMMLYGSNHQYIPGKDEMGTGEITKTSKKNARMLNDMFKYSQDFDSDTSLNTRMNTANLFINMDITKVLNFDGASPEFRAYINKTAFNVRIQDFWDKFAKIDAKFIDEELLKYAAKMDIPHIKDTTGAKTQAAKNANIVPPQYAKARDALIRLVERQEIHDKNNHGATKTQTQRFKEVMRRMGIDFTVRSLARDVYIKMIQRDIIDGRAADLLPIELSYVLHGNMDKDGFYVRHVPKELLKGSIHENLNSTQRAIVSARASENTVDTVRSKRLSMRDKRAAIDNMAREIDGEAPAREKLATELKQFDADYQTDVQAPYDTYMALHAVHNSVEEIQRAFKKITDNLKNGTPNDLESHLATATVEKTVFEYITGTANKMVETPDWGGLPLFGRGAEKERRDQLNRAIRNFNETLTRVRDKSGHKHIDQWSEYRGKILNPQSLTDLDREQQIARNIMNDMQSQFNRNHDKHDRLRIKFDMERHETKAKKLSQAKEDFNRQQAALRDLSKSQLGIDQDGELTPVTPDMSPDVKRRTRAKNRDILTDKLAARRGKKPSHTMAQMLAPNKNER